MEQRGFGVLVDNLMRGVEACRRRLGDIGNALAKKLAAHIWGRSDQIDAVKFNRSADNLAAVTCKAHGSQAKRGFSGTGFTNQAQNLTTMKVKIDIIDDARPGLIGNAVNLEVTDLNQKF